jgi:hypothetical protein|tara:strand:+ start:392 stop:643 length:252 start_codon:yes stop_codon:yes gene_type:complete
MEISINSTTQKRVVYDINFEPMEEVESGDRYLSVHLNCPTVGELLDVLRIAAQEISSEAEVWSQVSDGNKWWITIRDKGITND